MDWLGGMAEQLEQGSLDPAKRQEWDRRVRGLSSAKFAQTVTDALRQMDDRQYAAHLKAADAGVSSIGNTSREEKRELARALLEELSKLGLERSSIEQESGASTDPEALDPEGLIKLLAWTQVNHPQVIGSVAARYKDRPELLAHLLGTQTLLVIASNLHAGPAGEAA